MDRSASLMEKAAVKLQSGTTSFNAQTASGLAPYTGPWETPQVVHLLKRTMFGASQADIRHFKSQSLSACVDELLNPAVPLPSPPVKEYDIAGAAVPDTAIQPGTTWVNDPNGDGTITSRRRASFKKWWTGVMINQDRSIREKLTLFWHNHFATESTDVGDSQYVYKHHNLLRTNCLGNFKSMVKAVTIDPCMLRYLNGYLNTGAAPDENYARELQELFTLGKENNPNYTEDDVKAAARVLTGWRISSATISSSFDNNRHDKNNKQFSSFYNNAVVTGRNSATAGELELNDLLNMIFSKQAEVSTFIAKKIYRWFCYYDVDTQTQADVIEPMAKIFRESNWEIRPMLSALLNSEHFYDVLNTGCMIKSPVDTVIGMCREFKMVFPDPVNQYGDAYAMWDHIRNHMAIMGQNYGDPPDVAGWSAYYQAPQFYGLWINSDTLPKRNRFTDQFMAAGYSRNGKTIKIDPVAFAKSLSNTGDPNVLINDSLDILYQVPISDASKQTVKNQILLSGTDSDYYWSNAWNAYIANPGDNVAYNAVFLRLRDLYKYLMNLAEYQLM